MLVRGDPQRRPEPLGLPGWCLSKRENRHVMGSIWRNIHKNFARIHQIRFSYPMLWENNRDFMAQFQLSGARMGR